MLRKGVSYLPALGTLLGVQGFKKVKFQLKSGVKESLEESFKIFTKKFAKIVKESSKNL